MQGSEPQRAPVTDADDKSAPDRVVPAQFSHLTGKSPALQRAGKEPARVHSPSQPSAEAEKVDEEDIRQGIQKELDLDQDDRPQARAGKTTGPPPGAFAGKEVHGVVDNDDDDDEDNDEDDDDDDPPAEDDATVNDDVQPGDEDDDGEEDDEDEEEDEEDDDVADDGPSTLGARPVNIAAESPAPSDPQPDDEDDDEDEDVRDIRYPADEEVEDPDAPDEGGSVFSPPEDGDINSTLAASFAEGNSGEQFEEVDEEDEDDEQLEIMEEEVDDSDDEQGDQDGDVDNDPDVEDQDDDDDPEDQEDGPLANDDTRSSHEASYAGEVTTDVDQPSASKLDAILNKDDEDEEDDDDLPGDADGDQDEEEDDVDDDEQEIRGVSQGFDSTRDTAEEGDDQPVGYEDDDDDEDEEEEEEDQDGIGGKGLENNIGPSTLPMDEGLFEDDGDEDVEEEEAGNDVESEESNVNEEFPMSTDQNDSNVKSSTSGPPRLSVTGKRPGYAMEGNDTKDYIEEEEEGADLDDEANGVEDYEREKKKARIV